MVFKGPDLNFGKSEFFEINCYNFNEKYFDQNHRDAKTSHGEHSTHIKYDRTELV